MDGAERTAVHPQATSPRRARVHGLLWTVVGALIIFVLLRGWSNDPTTTAASRVVHISGVACAEPREGVGVAVGGGLVLASGHVVDGVTDPRIVLGSGETVRGTVIYIDRTMDVSVISAPTPPFDAPVIRDAEAGERGQVVIMDKEGALSSIPYSIDRKIKAVTLDVGRNEDVNRPSLQLTAALKLGDSGAPLFDDAGEIVGLVWAISTTDETRSFAVQGDEVAAVLRRAESEGTGPGTC